jgi:hypothetical protein
MQNKNEVIEKFNRQRDELRAELLQEWQRRLKGLMDFYEIQNEEIQEDEFKIYLPTKNTAIPSSNVISSSIPPGKTGYSLYESVRKAIEHVNGNDFTLGEIFETVEKNYPGALRPSVSAVLSKMAAAKELKVIEQGAGKRASVYQMEK